MEEQTLEQFKAMQRREMNDAISSGKPVNSLTGFVLKTGVDNEVARSETKKFKKRWNKLSKSIELKNQKTYTRSIQLLS